MRYLITDIAFDCSLEDDDWTPKDQQETEEFLPQSYIGSIWDASDGEDLLEELTCASGWCITRLDYKHILS